MSKMKLTKPQSVFFATVKFSNNFSAVVAIKDYTGKKTRKH